ncbi:hypothetical protein [Sphingobacterium sp. LRF_L2]|uniref:hypothetical protein n=1 Tax=Sphingobacterium sp. LRF_L2 TaxID=3369421 RepID=UPI003F636D29
MTITRIFNDRHGDSHFEDLHIPLIDQGEIGFLSAPLPVNILQLRKVAASYNFDFHCAPQQQYIILLDGGVEIENSLGEIRQFPTGSILLVEDTEGKGHRTKNLENKERTSLFIHL